jgi:hypothetical protein
VADVAVFVSYRHDDDDASYGRIKTLSDDIRQAYKSLNGLDVELFFDVDSIELGENWRQRIRSGLVSATVLLAFISPLYLRSMACREELQEFISALSVKNSEKLIIPLLFAPIENIEQRFQDDELWHQIRDLQFMSIHELRRVDPGSEKWMVAADKVADRMRQVLAVKDMTIPPPVGAVEEIAEPEPTVQAVTEPFDIGAEFRELSSNFIERTALLDEINPKLEEVASYIARGGPGEQVTEHFNGLAAELNSPVNKYSELAISYQQLMGKSAENVARWLREIGATPERDREDSTPRLLASIKGAAEAVLGSVTAVQDLSGTIDKLKGKSLKLDRVLQRFQSALIMTAGYSGVFKNWIEEIEDLGY